MFLSNFMKQIREFFCPKFNLKISFAGILLFLSLSQLCAAKPAQSPVRIRSDIIDIKQKSNNVEFIKNVVVEKDNSSLIADKMLVIYNLSKSGEEKSATDKSEIKQIDAFGNVRIFSEEFIASGNRGHYNPKSNSFTLKENVIVNNGTSIASGDEFVYEISSKKGEFIGKKSEANRAKSMIGNQFQKKGKWTSQTRTNNLNEEDDRIMVIINEEAENENFKSRKTKPKNNR